MASVLQFSDFVLSSRGLLARPILPVTPSTPAFRADLQAITYAIYDKDASDVLVDSGVLNVADVMYTALVPWPKDPIGHTFAWPVPGTVFQDPHRYRIVITCTIINSHPTYPTLSGKAFLMVWQNNVQDP